MRKPTTRWSTTDLGELMLGIKTNFRLIAIDREYACGASGIAHQLAARLSWNLFDRAILREIAIRTGVPLSVVESHDEALDPWWYRMLKVFTHGLYDPVRINVGNIFEADTIATLYKEIISDIANGTGCIIVGRGAPQFLRDDPRVFRVLLFASHRERVRRLTALGKTYNQAAGLIEQMECQRTAFAKHYFGDPSTHLYHLLVNTSLGDLVAVETILSGMAALQEVMLPLESAGYLPRHPARRE